MSITMKALVWFLLFVCTECAAEDVFRCEIADGFREPNPLNIQFKDKNPLREHYEELLTVAILTSSDMDAPVKFKIRIKNDSVKILLKIPY